METVKTVMMIPADPRNGKPLVTSAMKAACIGEFSVEREAACPSCYFEGEVPEQGCTICGGTLTYTEKIDVPWDTMKDIYKMMANVAASGITAPVQPPVFTVGFDPPMKGDHAAVAIRIGEQLAVFTVKPQ